MLELNNNFGPADARNQGVKQATGDIIAFLDNDTEVDKNWIINALKEFNQNKKIGCIQSKLLLLDEKNKFDHFNNCLD